jgi:signal transduction histidine kinase
MAVERLRSTSIVWTFAVTSFIVFGLIGVGIAVLRSGDLRARSEEAATVRAELIADSIIRPLLRPEDLAGPVLGARYRELDRSIHEFAMEDAGVLRVKIWNTDGMIVFSNDREQVGQTPEIEHDLEEAFEGEVESEISELEEAENASERQLADQLFETYVPVSVAGGAESDDVDAVIEVYQDYSTIQDEINRLNDTLKVSLGIGLLALYVLLLPVMIGTTRTLRRQNAQLHDQADQLGVLLAREQETVAELRALDRLKSDFAAAASHELRTPLTTIRGFAQLLKERSGDDPGARDAVEAIVRQTAHLQRLVGNLLREAQLEHDDQDVPIGPTSVPELLEEVRSGFPGAANRLTVRVDPAMAPMTLDEVAVHEIVANLVDNALKYSDPETPVDVEAVLEDEGTLRLTVRDEGHGIPPGDLPRIFDRFTQLDGSSTRSHGGVGLGLHLVRELTRRCGGEVTVDSVVGRGTTFTVTLPITIQPTDTGPQRSELSSA